MSKKYRLTKVLFASKTIKTKMSSAYATESLVQFVGNFLKPR